MTFPVTFPSRPHFPACSLREIIKTHPERGNSRLQRFLIRFGDTLRTALSGSLICSSLFLFFPSDHKQKDRSTFPPWVEEIFFFFLSFLTLAGFIVWERYRQANCHRHQYRQMPGKTKREQAVQVSGLWPQLLGENMRAEAKAKIRTSCR